MRWLRPNEHATSERLDCGCTTIVRWRHRNGDMHVNSIETIYCPKHDPEKEKS